MLNNRYTTPVPELKRRVLIEKHSGLVLAKELFLDVITGLEVIIYRKFPNYVFYFKELSCFFVYDLNVDQFEVDNYKVYQILRKECKITDSEIRELIISMAREYFKLNVKTIDGQHILAIV